MDRTEEIRQAASSYRTNDGEGVRGWEEAAFETGATWADEHPKSPWVSVKERLPKIADSDLFGTGEKQTMLVLTASRTGRGYSVNRWNGHEWLYTGDVGYWMPVPQLPKKGGAR